MKQHLIFLTFSAILVFSCQRPSDDSDLWIAEAPAGDKWTAIDFTGETIIPNGRIVKPFGKTIRVAPHPYGLTLSPDGKIAITANSGTSPFSISILENLQSATPTVRQIPEGAKNDEGILESVFMGLAITPDNKFVYVGGGQSNKIFKFDIASGTKTDSVICGIKTEDRDFTHGYIGDLLLSKDGKRLYALDQIGFRLIIVDTETNAILENLSTGRYPFGLCFSPDQTSVYVANVGMFEYSYFKHLDPERLKETSKDFPAFGYGSKEMKEGIQKDGLDIPGLGDPNAPESFSVWKFNLTGQPAVAKRIKTGILVGDLVDGIPAVGGASPNSLVASDKYVFVSNGNNDCISVIDFEQDTVIKNIFLHPDPRVSKLRGVIPFGLTLSVDQKQLFVAEAGINAIGVIDAEKLEVLGHIPAGWFPSKVKTTPDGKSLIVTNAKGFGSGPNGGNNFTEGPEGNYVGNLMKGSVSIMEIPDASTLEQLTQQVIHQNFKFKKADASALTARKGNPVPVYPGADTSPIKHIIFISKENRTYDEVFGQVKAGKGEPSMARYGANQLVVNRNRTDSVASVTVMPNHLALANRFSISDNFYVDSDHSADGHRWLVSTYPNEWVETSVAAAYGGKRGARSVSKAPGNFALVGASGAIYPEDYNEAGSLWDHLSRNQISFYNFGFGVELASSFEDSTLKYTGVRYLVNFPIPGPLFEHSSKQYPTYNMAIPDQFRVDQFIREVNEKYLEGGQPLPKVMTVILPNDHGAGDRKEAGYPFRASYMMDNDLALGRIVEFLSHTPYWKNMAIVVTEDDSQDGRDHVDAHRSILMVISPYSKKNYVGHQHYSFGSIFKTFWHILGIPYLNQYDAGATDFSDLFTSTPDFSPYEAFPVDKRVFDPEKVLKPFDEKFDWKAVVESPILDHIEH